MRLKHCAKTAAIVFSIFFFISTGYAIADDIIRIASPYKVLRLDPVRSAAAGTIELYGQLYSRVLRLDDAGELAPGLASSWEVSDGGKTITLKLRSAKFSDGSPLTADDVVFSLLRIRDHKESAYPAPMQQLESATAQGADTVVLKLKSAFAPFIGNLEIWNMGIVSKQDVESRGEEKAFAKNPLASGPYKVKNWLPGDRMILEPNPYYWRKGYPKNSGAELLYVADENTRISMLLAGEVDAVRGVPWSQVASMKKRSDISVPLEPSTMIFMSLLNHKGDVFSDVRVRQAASYALNKEAIAKAITFGNAKVANTTIPGSLLFHHKDYPGLKYNPEKAKKLLKEANAVGKEVVIVITATDSDGQKMAEIMQAQWGAIGLKAKIEKVDGGTFWKRIPGGEYDAAPTWWFNETLDPDLAIRWAICGACGSKAFYTFYDNPKITELTEAGARELDTDKRRAIYHQIQEISTNEVSQIPFFYPPFPNAYGARISGLILTPALQWTLEETTVIK
jgi:peptide/nickel transport system substrate-binding protein